MSSSCASRTAPGAVSFCMITPNADCFGSSSSSSSSSISVAKPYSTASFGSIHVSASMSALISSSEIVATFL